MEQKRKLSISSLVTASEMSEKEALNELPVIAGEVKTNQEIKSDDDKLDGSDKDEEIHDHDADLVIAAEALTKLNSREFCLYPSPKPGLGLNGNQNLDNSILQHPLIEKVTNHPIISQAVRVYENSKNNYPIFNYGAGMFERAAKPMVKNFSKNLNNHINKKQKMNGQKKITLPSISETLYKNKGFQEIQENFNQLNKTYTEFNLNMSIESKNRIQFCLHLLKLANVQITNKVNNLQQIIVEKQRRKSEKLIESKSNEKINTKLQTKKEIITTIKKIVNVFAKFTGNNISEPARLNIRESLLKLPVNWTTSLNNSVPNSPSLNPLESLSLSNSPSKSSSVEITVNSNSSSTSSSKTSSQVNLSDLNEISLDTVQYNLTCENTQREEYEHQQPNKNVVSEMGQLPNLDISESIETTNIIDNDDKVLLLAKESLDMISNMMNIFNEQLNKAETWIKQKKDDEVKKKSLLKNETTPTSN